MMFLEESPVSELSTNFKSLSAQLGFIIILYCFDASISREQKLSDEGEE